MFLSGAFQWLRNDWKMIENTNNFNLRLSGNSKVQVENLKLNCKVVCLRNIKKKDVQDSRYLIKSTRYVFLKDISQQTDVQISWFKLHITGESNFSLAVCLKKNIFPLIKPPSTDELF